MILLKFKKIELLVSNIISGGNTMSIEQRSIMGEKIKRLRTAKGVTQEKMSEALYIARSCLANYEINKRTPNDDMLRSIATYLGVDAKELLQ